MKLWKNLKFCDCKESHLCMNVECVRNILKFTTVTSSELLKYDPTLSALDPENSLLYFGGKRMLCLSSWPWIIKLLQHQLSMKMIILFWAADARHDFSRPRHQSYHINLTLIMNMSISDNLFTVSSIEEEEYISTQEF